MNILYVLLFIVLAWITWKLVYHIILVIRVKFIYGVPFISQPLFMMPFKIPFLADYFFINGFSTIRNAILEYAPKHKWVHVVVSNHHGYRIANPQDIKNISITKAAKSGKAETNYSALAMYGQNILSALNPATWKPHRAICGPAFDERHLDYMANTCQESVDLLFKRWQNSSLHNSKSNNSSSTIVIEPFKEFTELTLDIIGKTGFGYDLKVLEEANGASKKLSGSHKMSFKEALEYSITKTLMMKLLMPKFLQWRFVFPTAFTAYDEVKQYITEIVEDRKKQGIIAAAKNQEENQEQLDLLSLMLKTNENTDEKTGFKLSMDELISNAWIFLFAGHDTTATALQWLLFELAKQPAIQQKMRDEINQISESNFSYSDTKKVEYVKRVINENLRLHPPVPSVLKRVSEPVELSGGHIVPANTGLGIDIYSVHHDPEIWPEPFEFKPERFEEVPKPCTFIPFSVGPRSCIGANFSIAEQVIIISRIIKQYQVGFPEGLNVANVKEIQSGPIVRPSNLKIELKAI